MTCLFYALSPSCLDNLLESDLTATSFSITTTFVSNDYDVLELTEDLAFVEGTHPSQIKLVSKEKGLTLPLNLTCSKTAIKFIKDVLGYTEAATFAKFSSQLSLESGTQIEISNTSGLGLYLTCIPSNNSARKDIISKFPNAFEISTVDIAHMGIDYEYGEPYLTEVKNYYENYDWNQPEAFSSVTSLKHQFSVVPYREKINAIAFN